MYWILFLLTGTLYFIQLVMNFITTQQPEIIEKKCEQQNKEEKQKYTLNNFSSYNKYFKF